jgi:hypothetical protein
MANYERPNAFHKPALPAKSCLFHKGYKREKQAINHHPANTTTIYRPTERQHSFLGFINAAPS